jgi:hypothetical protein
MMRQLLIESIILWLFVKLGLRDSLIMRTEDRFLAIISVCFVILTGVIIYGIQNQEKESAQQQDQDRIEGIVVHRNDARVWLMLTQIDQPNNINAGQVRVYRLMNSTGDDVDIGDLLMGTLLDNEILIHQSRVDFMDYSEYGFVLKGDLVVFSSGKIRQSLSDPYPSLRFGISNLGEKEVIGVRVKVNGELLPYSFGVSKQSPLAPSVAMHWNRYIAWHDPKTGKIAGYTPNDGDEYTIEVTIKYDDYSIKTFTSTCLFEIDKGYAISTLVGFDKLIMKEPDLLSYGSGSGGSLCFWLRNEWYEDGSKEVERLEVYVDGVLIWCENLTIKGGRYFAVLIDVPFDIVQEKKYDVSLIAYSADDKVSNHTISVICQYYRIH